MSKAEILSNQRKRLGVIRHYEEVTHNVSKTCRYFGISGIAFYSGIEDTRILVKSGSKIVRATLSIPRATAY